MSHLRTLILLLVASISRGAPADISQLLETVRAKHRLPALVGAAYREGEVVAQGVSGVRQMGSKDQATLKDLWHIGSCTKSMTATLAGILVDAGTVRWEWTVGEAFPEFRSSMKAPWPSVTLDQLLTNRSGAPTAAPPAAWLAASAETGTPRQQRLNFIRSVLGEPVEAPPGTKYIYSNQGFTIAGAMLERAAKKPFEALLAEKIFVPLGMKSAGFGTPEGKQPRGHDSAGGTFTPVQPGKGSDNPIAITPAGRVHCSITDFARFASWHARGPLKDTKLMSEATFTRLHTAPPGQQYAMGWIVDEREGAKGTVLKHNGSNTRWYAVVSVAPATQSAYVAITNAAGNDATKACEEVVSALIQGQ